MRNEKMLNGKYSQFWEMSILKTDNLMPQIIG